MRHPEENSCKTVRKLLDAYASNELLVETTADVVAHLESCSSSAAALDTLDRDRTAVKNAVIRETPPPGLESRIRSGILRESPQRAQKMWVVAAVILLSVFLGGFGIWNSRKQVEGAADIQNILRMGLEARDRCPVQPGIDALGDYDGITEVIGDEMPSRYGIASAHRCMLDGRLFVQVVLEDSKSRVSFVMTEKRGERLSTSSSAAHALDAEGVPVYSATIGEQQIAAFETRNQLAFLVSDLPRDMNLQLASTIAALYAPLVRSTLQEASRVN